MIVWQKTAWPRREVWLQQCHVSWSLVHCPPVAASCDHSPQAGHYTFLRQHWQGTDTPDVPVGGRKLINAIWFYSILRIAGSTDQLDRAWLRVQRTGRRRRLLDRRRLTTNWEDFSKTGWVCGSTSCLGNSNWWRLSCWRRWQRCRRNPPCLNCPQLISRKGCLMLMLIIYFCILKGFLEELLLLLLLSVLYLKLYVKKFYTSDNNVKK